ncbi:hypothetical protein [Frankia sp. CcWB3]
MTGLLRGLARRRGPESGHDTDGVPSWVVDRLVALTRQLDALARQIDALVRAGNRHLDQTASARSGAAAPVAAAPVGVVSRPGDGDGFAEPGAQEPHPVALRVIDVLDRLDVLVGQVGSAPLDPAALAWVRQSLADLLPVCEVHPVRDEGPADPRRHEVLNRRPAPDTAGRDLTGHIAATIRPGYRWRDDLLRPQQVTVFGHPEAEAAATTAVTDTGAPA